MIRAVAHALLLWAALAACCCTLAFAAGPATQPVVGWGPLPAGWSVLRREDGGTPIALESSGSEPFQRQHLYFKAGEWGSASGGVLIDLFLSDRQIRSAEELAGEFSDRPREVTAAEFNEYPALRGSWRDAHASEDSWALQIELGGRQPFLNVSMNCTQAGGAAGRDMSEAEREAFWKQVHEQSSNPIVAAQQRERAASATAGSGRDACAQRYATEIAAVLRSIRFERPRGSLSASILLPPELRPGDVVSPSALVVDEYGNPPVGEIALVWYFDGNQTNSVVWDGRPLRIELQATADGQPLAAAVTLPAFGTAPVPTVAVRPPLLPTGPVPGLSGAGELPGPRNTTEGLSGTLGPAALGLLGALLSGLLNAPKGPQAPPRGPKPGKTPPPRRAPTEPKPATPGDEPRKPAHPERAARARRAAEAAERAQREADEANRPGRLFTDTLGRSGKEIVDTAKTIGEAAKSARRTIGHTLTGLREVVSDRKALAQAARAGVRGLTDGMRLAGRVAEGVAGAAADGLIAAQDAAARVYQNPGLLKSAAGAAAKALWKQLSDPKVLWGALKEFSGLQNFENALDPKRSLLQRIGEVGAGTFKLYGAAQMAASAASAARDAAGRALGGGKAAAGALGERGAASATARAGARAPHTVAPGTVVRPSAPPRPIPRPNAPYRPAVRPPDLRGMPRANVKHAQVVADKYGVQIHVRPTNPEARRLLEAGAHPKPEYLKMKTINSDDILLGAPRDGAGKVGYFKPEMPPRGKLSDDAWQRLEARAAQRAKEFDDQAPKVAELLEKGKIRVRPDGTVVHGTTGRPFTGDHDLFDIRGVKGETLPAAVRERIQRELSNGPFRAQHPEHVAWDYSNLRRTLAPGETSSPYDIARGVDEKILNSHARGGEPLIRFRSDRPITSSWYTGGSRA